MNTTDEMMNTTEEMEEEVMSEETTTDLVEYEDEDEEPGDGAVALTVLGIFGAGAAIGVAVKAIIDKIRAGKQSKQYNPEKPTLRQRIAIKLAPELYLKEDDEKAGTPSEDETDDHIDNDAKVHDDIQETPKEEDKEVAEETTNTKKKKK